MFNKLKKERKKYFKDGRIGIFYYLKRIYDFKGFLVEKNKGEFF